MAVVSELSEIIPGAPSAREVRLTAIGPLPPPLHGQSAVTGRMVSDLARSFPRMRIANNSVDGSGGFARLVHKFRRSTDSCRAVRGADAVYISVNANRGMWLTAMEATLARWAGSRILLHHHSYSYIRERRMRMIALAVAAGPRAHHVVLSHSMAGDLMRSAPEVRRTLVVNNAGFVDQSLLDIPLKEDSADLVLGHLSNLTVEKGVGEVVDLAVALHRTGLPVRLIVGGPIADAESQVHLDRAERELGERFEYRGPLAGDSKIRFYAEISHFVFPSRYKHEAAPLVLYEAMAAGAVCVATRQGSIPEQLEGSPSILADNADSFVAEVLPALSRRAVTSVASAGSRQAFLQALSDFDRQMAAVVDTIAAAPTA